MSRVCWAALLLVVLLPSVTFGSTLTTLFLDDFESQPSNVLNSTLIHWDVVMGSIDVLAPGNVCGTAGDPSNCVDLDGTEPAGGSIQSKVLFALLPGPYRLLFDLAGSQRGIASDTVTVQAGSFVNEDITLRPDSPFATFQRDFTVSSPISLRLAFAHHGADQIGLLLDNVRLGRRVECRSHGPDPDPDPMPQVPEPATLLLVGSGLILTFWRRMRARPRR
jgi:hypothetical protein